MGWKRRKKNGPAGDLGHAVLEYARAVKLDPATKAKVAGLLERGGRLSVTVVVQHGNVDIAIGAGEPGEEVERIHTELSA